MSASEENLAHLDNYIPTGVLCGNNGYYILTMSEDDTTPTDGVKGGEYSLMEREKLHSKNRKYILCRGYT